MMHGTINIKKSNT